MIKLILFASEVILNHLANKEENSRVFLDWLLPFRSLEVLTDLHHIGKHLLSKLFYHKLFHKVGKVANAVVEVSSEFKHSDSFAQGLISYHEEFELHLHIFLIRNYINTQLSL